MSRQQATLILSLAVVVVVGAGDAIAATPTPAGGTTWAPNQSVPFRWKEGSEPPGWARVAVLAAADDNNDSRASRAAVLTHQDGALSWVGYTSDIPSAYAIAYTVATQPDSFRIRLRPHGYMLDWGALRWCQFYDDPPTGCYDLEMVTLHEMGHVQSLDHPDEADVATWTDTVMHEYPKTKARTGWNQHEYGSCDVARLQIRYRPLTPSTPYSTCLNLPSELTLGASATQMESGNSVTFTARLTVDDAAIYPNLAGQPASGRTIKLQRRAPGGTSWSTVADMNPGANEGVYGKSLTLTATYDWRVLFPDGAEGLQTSTSSLVKVTVYPSCQMANVSGMLIEPQYPIC
jgi:hypothetical protein